MLGQWRELLASTRRWIFERRTWLSGKFDPGFLRSRVVGNAWHLCSSHCQTRVMVGECRSQQRRRRG